VRGASGRAVGCRFSYTILFVWEQNYVKFAFLQNVEGQISSRFLWKNLGMVYICGVKNLWNGAGFAFRKPWNGANLAL
jgi:hypothetical protein